MIANQKSLYSIKLLTDIILLNLSFLFSAWIAQPSYMLFQRPHMFLLVLGLNILWYITAKATDFYNNINPPDFFSQVRVILRNIVFQIIASMFFIFTTKEDLFTRNFIILYFSFLILFISLRIILLEMIQTKLYNSGKYARGLIVIGINNVGRNFVKLIEDNPNLGYDFLGFIDDNLQAVKEKVLGKINDLDTVIQSMKVDDVVITTTNMDFSKLSEIVNSCNKNALRIHIIPDYFEFLSQKFSLSSVGGFPIITVRKEPLAEIQLRFVKRSFDIVFSLFVIVLVLSWLVPLIAIIIKLSSKGPVFFIQKRVGLKNGVFGCIKFCSMYTDERNKKNEFIPTVENDPRITRVGKFLRKTNLDEIPQFGNVLKGDMSIVGPRPHAIAFNQEYLRYFDAIKLRNLVKPGITGWAQIHGLRGDVEDATENRKRTIKRIEHDIWYIENWSFLLDIQIIFLTIWQMLTGSAKVR